MVRTSLPGLSRALRDPGLRHKALALLALALLVASVRVSWAEEHAEPIVVSKGRSLSLRVKANLNDYSDEFTLSLRKMTSGLVAMKFDFVGQSARLGLGGGDPNAFRLRLESDVLVTGSQARVQSRLDLAVAGYRLAIDVPVFDVKTESVAGARAVELRLPVFEGRF